MEIPTVKSCCCFNLKTVGLMFGFFQVFIYSLAILIYVSLRGFLLIPIILMPIAMNIGWIYGIQEKKPMMMLPAMIPFVLASLVCISFVAVYPIGVVFSAHAFIQPHEICWGDRNSRGCTSYIEIGDYGPFLGIWMVSSAVACIVVYITIILYSVYKSVKENYNQNRLHLPTTTTN